MAGTACLTLCRTRRALCTVACGARGILGHCHRKAVWNASVECTVMEQSAAALCGVVGAEAQGLSMHDLTIDAFPPDRLADIVRWRNNLAVNKYLRQGIRTLTEVQEWYAQYFSQTEHKLFAVYGDKALIGYGMLEHIDTTHRSCEIGIVIGDPHYWNKGLGAMVVTRLTTLALTTYHLHRVYAVIQGGNIASRRCFEKVGFQHEGRLRDARYVNGEFIDLHYYAILAHEWTS